jgi:peroxiredoxin
MNRKVFAYCLILAALVVLPILLVVLGLRGGDIAVKREDEAPNFLLIDNQGNRITTQDMLERKFGLVFFSADCDYCVEELKQLNSLIPKYQEKFKLIFVSLSDSETTERVKSKIGLLEKCYPASSDILNRFKVKNIPMLFLIDERGKISFRQTGMRSLDFQTLIIDRFVGGESLNEEAIRSVYKP